MKRWLQLTVIGLVLFFCAPAAFALSLVRVTDWGPWDDFQLYPGNPVGFTETGPGSGRILADGTKGEAWGMIQTPCPAAVGIAMSLKPTELKGTGQIGIQRYLATTPSGNLILVLLFLMSLNGQEHVQYQVNEFTTGFKEVRRIAWGGLGRLDGDVRLGQEVILAFLLSGDEIWLYATTAPDALVRVQMLVPLTPASKYTCMVYGSANSGAGNRVQADVNSIWIIQP